jgi:hypothetical protein
MLWGKRGGKTLALYWNIFENLSEIEVLYFVEESMIGAPIGGRSGRHFTDWEDNYGRNARVAGTCAG